MSCKQSVMMIILSMFLTSCSIFGNTDDSHHRICSELKHRIVFSGGAEANDPNQAMEQRSEQAKLDQNYNQEHCD